MVLFYFNLGETETKGARACGIIKMFFLFISEVVGGNKNVAAAEIVRRKMKRFIKARGSVCVCLEKGRSGSLRAGVVW